jgi:AraC-like DNA-binding protein
MMKTGKIISIKDPDILEIPFEQHALANGHPFMCYKAVYNSSHHVHPHYHRALELVSFTGVEGETIAGGKAYPIDNQSVFWLASDSIHSFRIRPSMEGEAYADIFQFDLGCLTEYVGKACDLSLSDMVRASAHVDVKISGMAAMEIRSSLNELSRECRPDSYAVRPFKKAFGALSCVSGILSRSVPGDLPVVAQMAGEYRIREIMSIVSGLASSPMSLEQIARECLLSKSYLCRFFKKHTRMTIQEYITHIRISRAKRLMCDEGRTVTQACFECGFSSPSYFIARFSKIMGVTPKQWVLDAVKT